MKFTRRRALVAGAVIGFVACCFGCNPFMIPAFFDGEAQDNATLKRLVTKEDKKEVKVAVVVSSQLDARQELRNVDRELSRRIADQLRAISKTNEEKLVVVETSKVNRFLTNHPGWENLDPTELADQMKTALKVDYVISVEIESMSLYERGSRELFRGNADLKVVLLNANDPEDNDHQKPIRARYPSESAGGVELADSSMNVFDFRDKFLDILAKKIAYCFCNHPTINQMDDTRETPSE